jgi:hypothetical protein
MSSNKVEVTLSVEEYNRLNLEASAHGRTLEQYLRDLSVGTLPPAPHEQAEPPKPPAQLPPTPPAPAAPLETQDVGSNVERRRGRGRSNPAAE